jgi:hypothetical protein
LSIRSEQEKDFFVTPQQAPPLLRLVYNLNLHLQSRLIRFPKSHRLLASNLAEHSLIVLTLLAEANGSRQTARRTERLNRARERLAALRICLRLCQDLRCLSQTEHAHLAAQVEDSARQLDGWLRYIQKTSDGANQNTPPA